MLYDSPTRIPRSTLSFKLIFSWGMLASVLLLGSVPRVWGGDVKRIELASLLPDTVGLAIEVRGLTEQAEKVLKSDIAQRIQQHSAWRQVLNSAEIRKLKEVDTGVRSATGHSLGEWLDTILGREAILAVSPFGDPRLPGFVLLTRLKQRDELETILGAWSKLDERQETRFSHHGQVYFSRAKGADSSEVLYYAQIEDLAVLSDQSSALTEILDLTSDRKPVARLSNSPRFQRILQLLNSDATIRVFVQPKIWHSTVHAEQSPSTDPGERFVQQAWLKSQAMGIGVRFESGVIAEAIALSDELAESESWHKFVERTKGSPAFLARVPRTALMAFGGRHDFSALADWGVRQLPPEKLKQFKSIRQMIKGVLLGRDLLDDILPQLPTDFGGYLVPRSELELDAAPVDGLIAVSLPTKNPLEISTARAPLRGALSNAAQTGFNLLTALHNSSSNNSAELKDEDQNGTSIYWIESIGPYRPAYSVSDDAILFASSPQLIRDYLKQSATETWGADSDLRKFRDACFADASQVLALHGRLAREFVGQNRPFFIRQLISAHQLTTEDANKRLDRMLEWVQLSDAVVLATTFSNDHIKVVLGVAVESQPKKR